MIVDSFFFFFSFFFLAENQPYNIDYFQQVSQSPNSTEKEALLEKLKKVTEPI